MVGLEDALEKDGWQQPNRFYVIAGTMAEPTFSALAEITGHPCDVLADMWRTGIRLDGEPLALAIVAEGSRHLRYEELETWAPDTLVKMVQIAQERLGFGPEEWTEEIETAVRTAWEGVTADVPAPQMPDELRVRERNSLAVVRDGWTLMVIRDQDGDPEVLDPIPPDRLELSRVPHFMWLFLTGREPTD